MCGGKQLLQTKQKWPDLDFLVMFLCLNRKLSLIENLYLINWWLKITLITYVQYVKYFFSTLNTLEWNVLNLYIKLINSLTYIFLKIGSGWFKIYLNYIFKIYLWSMVCSERLLIFFAILRYWSFMRRIVEQQLIVYNLLTSVLVMICLNHCS